MARSGRTRNLHLAARLWLGGLLLSAVAQADPDNKKASAMPTCGTSYFIAADKVRVYLVAAVRRTAHLQLATFPFSMNLIWLHQPRILIINSCSLHACAMRPVGDPPKRIGESSPIPWQALVVPQEESGLGGNKRQRGTVPVLPARVLPNRKHACQGAVSAPHPSFR